MRSSMGCNVRAATARRTRVHGWAYQIRDPVLHYTTEFIRLFRLVPRRAKKYIKDGREGMAKSTYSAVSRWMNLDLR
jgi:hypothetical protein